MNAELIPMVAKEDDENTKSSTECVLVELGEVSTDTEGWGFLGWDGGMGLRW